MAGRQFGADTTLKFLYAVLKQLNMKNVDWNVVATDMEISNAAAARMRWFRFKQQMEGVPRSKPNADTNRVAKPKSRAKAKPKTQKKTVVKGEGSDNDEGNMKEEGSDNDKGIMKGEEEEEGEEEEGEEGEDGE